MKRLPDDHTLAGALSEVRAQSAHPGGGDKVTTMEIASGRIVVREDHPASGHDPLHDCRFVLAGSREVLEVILETHVHEEVALHRTGRTRAQIVRTTVRGEQAELSGLGADRPLAPKS